MMVLRTPRPTPAGLLAVALGGLALFGWGSFALTASNQRALKTELAEVRGERDALQSWQKQFKDAEAELRDVQGKIAAARDEVVQTSAAREKAKAARRHPARPRGGDQASRSGPRQGGPDRQHPGPGRSQEAGGAVR